MQANEAARTEQVQARDTAQPRRSGFVAHQQAEAAAEAERQKEAAVKHSAEPTAAQLETERQKAADLKRQKAEKESPAKHEADTAPRFDR